MPRKPIEFSEHPAAFDDVRAQGLYRAHCRYVVDGDTFDVLIDLGFQNYAYEALRLRDVDTPEIRGDERERGLAAKARVQELILDTPVLVRSFKDVETFGRFVADVLYWKEGEWLDLGETLVSEGHVK